MQYTLVSRTPGDLIQYALVSRTPGDLIQYTLVQAWGQAPKGLSPLDLSPFLRGLKSGLKSSFNKRA